jgi:uncharacterized protein YndB with AHSA1/START domain
MISGQGGAAVISAALSAVVERDRGRVWQALTTPAELIRWDDALVELLEPAAVYPEVGRPLRWRYRRGSLSVVLHDLPVEVTAPERLRSAVTLGLFRFDQVWTLSPEPGGAARTRLRLRVSAENAIPVVGGLVDRFAVRRLAWEYADARLRALQRWCGAPREAAGARCEAPPSPSAPDPRSARG